MNTLSLDQLRALATETLERVAGSPDLNRYIVGALLLLVVAMSLLTIWRGRPRNSVPAMTPSTESGFRRWLTPLGMKSIPAGQATSTRPPRTSGSNKTIRVSTPVSRVPTRALRARNADPLEIARRTGLARDAVVMMMANADPKAHATRMSAAKAAAQPATKAVTKTVTKTASTERAMTAPGAYAAAPRAKPAQGGRTLGTQFNARLS